LNMQAVKLKNNKSVVTVTEKCFMNCN